MSLLETEKIQCPYCWQIMELVVDQSIGQQEYIEDCEICCRPIIFDVVSNGGQIEMQVRREQD